MSSEYLAKVREGITSPAVLYGLLFCVLVALIAFFPSENRNTSRPLIRIIRPSPGATVVMRLDNNSFAELQEEPLHVEARSEGRSLVEDIVVCASSPDFVVSGCGPIDVLQPGDPVLQQHRQHTLMLYPVRHTGNASILVTATWTRYVPRVLQDKRTGKKAQLPADDVCLVKRSTCIGIMEQASATVGPVRLGIDKWSRFANRFTRFLKDLTLPVILIVLANWLTREASERDRRREELEKRVRDEKELKEKADEAARHSAEKEQEEQKQIAHLLLPKVMTLSGHYYLPLAANLRQFLRLTESTSTETREAAFYLLSFFHVARALKEKEGGIFFKDMAGEQIFTIANNVIRDLLVEVVSGEEEFMGLLDSFETFLPKGARRWPRYAELPIIVGSTWSKIEVWLGRAEPDHLVCVRFLFTVLLGTLRYESNAPYAHWYSNSRARNLFALPSNLPVPQDDAFQGRFRVELEAFKELLSVYRQGKER